MSAAVAGGILFGRWVARRARAPEGEGGSKPNRANASGAEAARATPEPRPAPPPAPKKPAADPLTEFPCHLGDVLMVHGGEEAWLAGALVFFESLPAAALFVAPEAGADRALFVRPNPSPSIVWLMPVPAGEVAVGPEPPTTLEHKGERFERVRRIPFRVERAGTGAPDVGDQALVAEYASGQERLLVIVGTGSPPRVFRGNVLEEGTYDVLAAGKSTLD